MLNFRGVVGGFSHPSEKMCKRQIGSFPQVFVVSIQKYLEPPPRYFFQVNFDHPNGALKWSPKTPKKIQKVTGKNLVCVAFVKGKAFQMTSHRS